MIRDPFLDPPAHRRGCASWLAAVGAAGFTLGWVTATFGVGDTLALGVWLAVGAVVGWAVVAELPGDEHRPVSDFARMRAALDRHVPPAPRATVGRARPVPYDWQNDEAS